MKPREKFLKNGAKSLSDEELLAVILRVGIPEKSVEQLATELLNLANGNLRELALKTPHELLRIKGMGWTKAMGIKAAFELGNRRIRSEFSRVKLANSTMAKTFCESLLEDERIEEFGVVLLDRAHRVLDSCTLSKGGVSGTVVDLRVVLKACVDHLASALVVYHNHPSGNVLPSEQDKRLTQKLKKACDYLDVRLLDHIIIGQCKHYSFADESLL